MRTCYHVWALQVLDHFNSFCSYFGLCSWEVIFRKFAIIVGSFVKWFYIFTIMTAMTFLNCAPSCLTIVVLVANFSALCLFEKPWVAFLHFRLDSCIVNKGEKVMHEKCCCIYLGSVQDRHVWNIFVLGCIGSGGACICSGGASMCWYVFRGRSFGSLLWWFLLFVYRWRGALLASPVRSRYELCSQVILFCLVFGFWSLVEFVVFRCCFSFIFHMVTMCVVNALIKGEIEDQVRPRTSVVAP